MYIEKCDICKKEIKDRFSKVMAGSGALNQFDLCADCGKPITTFLKKKKLIDQNA